MSSTTEWCRAVLAQPGMPRMAEVAEEFLAMKAQLADARRVIQGSLSYVKEGLQDLPLCLVGEPDAMAYTCLSDIGSDAREYLEKYPVIK